MRASLRILPVCGLLVISGSAFAQEAQDQAAPEPAVQEQSAGEATAPPVTLGQGTKAQAEHSAEATAHKSVSDPNNQLGTSLQGRTRPVVDADAKDTNVQAASPDAESPAVEAQATAPEAQTAPADPSDAEKAPVPSEAVPAQPAPAELAPAAPAQ